METKQPLYSARAADSFRRPLLVALRERRNTGIDRRRLALIPVLAFGVAAAGCRGKHHRPAVQNEEPSAESGPRVASALKMSDAAAQAQLLRGFYGLESGSWRWTAGTFSVLLRPPLAASQQGATLNFAFSIPDVVIRKLKTVTLTASVGAAKLKSESYSKAGPYTFTADVPAALLSKDSVTLDFALDKSLTAGSVDQRELGLVATAVSLESK